jgi:multidrug efflux pump subunit AcrB
VIIVVFIPTLFLTGIAKDLFSPLAITVAGAMLGSYIFSLTLIPITAAKLFSNHLPTSAEKEKTGFRKTVEKWRIAYQGSLDKALQKKKSYLAFTFGLFLLSLFGFANLGYELFPKTDVGQMEILVRKESGTPLRATEKTIAKMEGVLKEVMGKDLAQMVSNIGVFYDLPAAYTPNSGTQDAFIKVQLIEGHEKATDSYVPILRERFHIEFPGVEVSFNTGGLITAALNEGKSSPIDVQVKGNKLEILRALAERLRDTINAIPTTRDVRILQRIDQPTKEIDIDRVKAAELGVEPVDAIKNLVSALNSSTTFNKAFWIDEKNGNHYYVGVTYPESEINKEHTLENVIATSKFGNPVPYKLFSRITETTQPVEINHHNLTREFNVYANVEGADIGSVSDDIALRIEAFRKTLPKGYEVNFEGEVAVMKRSFANLGLGLILAILFAFLIITPLFQSFRQPLIIILAFPLGLIGIVALMMLTSTNLSIQSIMGIIMMVGISVSYGNILIDRINTLIKEGMQKREAIINGASDRFRPVLMTAATTVFGLLPTAIGIGDTGSANVPLAIAVIGGTVTATLLTLYIIPMFYLMIAKTQHHEN